MCVWVAVAIRVAVIQQSNVCREAVLRYYTISIVRHIKLAIAPFVTRAKWAKLAAGITPPDRLLGTFPASYIIYIIIIIIISPIINEDIFLFP